MDNKYLTDLITKRKRLRNFLKFPHHYEKIDENLENKVMKAKQDLVLIQKMIEQHFTKKKRK